MDVALQAARAKFLLELLMEQFNGWLALFLDNLESVQDESTLAVNDAAVAAWLEALGAVATLPQGEWLGVRSEATRDNMHARPERSRRVAVLLTSRWIPPAWQGEHLLLERVNYGDFLQIARQRLEPAFWQKRERMRRAYEALGGNPRGLEFLAAAVKDMDARQEDAFLAALEEVKDEVQADMALDAIYARLPAEAQTLLRRLPAYREPVPAEGILKLAPTAEPEALLERLLAVSLLEVSYQPDWDALEYALPPLVADWLETKDLTDDAPEWRSAAADYHLFLRKHERRTLTQAITAHHALHRAERHTEADRLTLDYVVGPLTMAGFYTALLGDWLPRICESQDDQTRADALGQTGKILHHLGNFTEALPYFQQSLAIRQQIGDKAGEGTTLNNISQIYDAQGDYETALAYLKRVCFI